jgi:hypothetical protein
MIQSGDYSDARPLTKESLLKMIYNAIDDLDIDNARKEVLPFVNDIRSLDIWSKDFFRAAAGKIKC